MPKPRVEDHIIDNPNVIKALGRAASDLTDKVILICCLDNGMRAGEVAHMQRSWWDGECIKIPTKQECTCYECNRQERGDNRGYWTPKTARASRIIPVRKEMRPYLNRFFRLHKEFPLWRVMIWHRVKRMQRIAGVKGNVFPHALRGTYITDLLDKEVPEAIVRDLVGHEKLDTTGKYTRYGKQRLLKHLEGKVW